MCHVSSAGVTIIGQIMHWTFPGHVTRTRKYFGEEVGVSFYPCVSAHHVAWERQISLPPLQNYMGVFSTYVHSIHLPGRLLKWLNLITAPCSVSNEPGSVTWLATKFLKTVSWRKHTEKLTTLWPQNISFWSKLIIPSSYFAISMLNLFGKYSQSPAWQLCDSCQIIDLINFKTTWLDLIPTLLESV